MGAVFGFLRSRWGGILASAGLTVVCMMLALALVVATTQKVIQEHRANALARSIDDPRTGWRVQVSSCQADFQHEKDAYSDLNTTLTTQTAALTALKTERDRRTTAAAAAAQASRTDFEHHAGARAAAILNWNPTGDLCAAANKVLSGEAP